MYLGPCDGERTGTGLLFQPRQPVGERSAHAEGALAYVLPYLPETPRQSSGWCLSVQSLSAVEGPQRDGAGHAPAKMPIPGRGPRLSPVSALPGVGAVRQGVRVSQIYASLWRGKADTSAAYRARMRCIASRCARWGTVRLIASSPGSELRGRLSGLPVLQLDRFDGGLEDRLGSTYPGTGRSVRSCMTAT